MKRIISVLMSGALLLAAAEKRTFTGFVTDTMCGANHYLITDRPERGFHRADFPGEERAIHLLYTHGSILRYNPASATDELSGAASQNVNVLRDYLQTRDVVTIGYSGWDDGLMSALYRCDAKKHEVYWCDVRPKPDPHVARFLEQRAQSAAYVFLGEEGADGLMRTLYHALIPGPDFCSRPPF